MKWASEAAEAAGTFALVFVGCGAIMATEATGMPGHVGTSLAFGLVIGSMIYASGHLSGAHFNPAVTIAFCATGHFPWARAWTYIVAQFGGAVAAAFTLTLLFREHGSLGQTTVSSAVDGTGAGFALEVLITAILMFVIASVATDGRAVGRLAGSAIGGAVALNALWAGPLTGASMNPARSVGPFLAAGAEADLGVWLYMVAPVAGALLGAFAYEFMRHGTRPEGRRAVE